MGNRGEATQLTIRARDLVGEPAALALLELVRDAPLNSETSAGTKSDPETSDGKGSRSEMSAGKEPGSKTQKEADDGKA